MVVLDGERREVEVDLDRRTVRVGAREWPIQVGDSADETVRFEILGEPVEVRREGDRAGNSDGAIAVNGELHSLAVESIAGSAARRSPLPGRPAPSFASAVSAAPEDDGPGRAIRPPMPGKVLEVRVRNGEPVAAGQVLVVVEAMKMRNEVAAPIAGVVAELRVLPGANVAARDVLLRLVGP